MYINKKKKKDDYYFSFPCIVYYLKRNKYFTVGGETTFSCVILAFDKYWISVKK